MLSYGIFSINARRLALLVGALVAAGSTHAASDVAYQKRLETRAQRLRLAADPEWRALLHYERDWLRSGVHSSVTTPWFFLAADGRRDPARELSADIKALFSRRLIGARRKPMPCLFPARRKFLIAALDVDTARLPDIACPEYRRWRALLSPRKISLVFPTAFANSPASMFGHTLLRIDSSRPEAGAELLSYAVNFAADPGDDGEGLKFVWKGLTGGYAGRYGVFPYYEKVKQYAWIENRDVWSYPLRLQRAEIARLTDHIWEMDRVAFTYFFLNKNCSYQLLSLLDVARPNLRLTRRFSWYAIPADTIRALAGVPDLLGPARFRPSMATTLAWDSRQLTAAQRRLAIAIADGRAPLDSPRLAALGAHARAAVLEVAHDDLAYRRRRHHAAPAEAREARVEAILRARSRIPVRSPFAPVPDTRTPPDQGHRSLRTALSAVQAGDTFSLGLRVRPAYHDLLDDPGGYTRGAQINFMDLGLRVDPASGALRVEDLRILNIVSLSPRSALFKPISFRLDAGLRRRPSPRVFTRAENDLGYYLEGGPGLTWGNDALMGYIFGLGSVDANPGLAPAYALAAGASAGVLAYPARGVQLNAEAGALQYAAGDAGHFRWAKLAAQLPLAGEWALRASFGWQSSAVDAGLTCELGLRTYF